MQYYYSIDGSNQLGPLDAEGLKAAGVHAGTMVWREGMPDWKPAGQVPELAGLFAGTTPPPAAPLPAGATVGSYNTPPSAGRPPQPGEHVQQPLNYSPPLNTSGTNGMAIASLICSICGLVGICCCGGLLCVLGVVFGHIARGQIRRGHGTGDAVALAGLIIGYIGIVLGILGLGFQVTQHGVRSSGPQFPLESGPVIGSE